MEYEDEEDSYEPLTPDDSHSEKSKKEEDQMFEMHSASVINGLINKTLLDESPPGEKRLTALDEMIIFAFMLPPKNDKLREAMKTLVLETYNDILSKGYVVLEEDMLNEETEGECFEAISEKDIEALASGLYSGYYSIDVIDSNGLNHLQQIIHSYCFPCRDKWKKIEDAVYQKYLNLRGGSHISG